MAVTGALALIDELLTLIKMGGNSALGAADDVVAMVKTDGASLDTGDAQQDFAADKTALFAQEDLASKMKPDQTIDAKQEIAVVMAVAKRALKNKILYFIPSTFAIAVLAPWAILPLTLGAGAYISHEAVGKIFEKHDLKAEAQHRKEISEAAKKNDGSLLKLEEEQIAHAVKVDGALSLELTGFQFGMVSNMAIATKLALLGITSVMASTALYSSMIGIIALNGLAHNLSDKTGGDWKTVQQRKIGKGLAHIAAPAMKLLEVVAVAALFYVGGHLLTSHFPGALQSVASLVSQGGIVQRLSEIPIAMIAAFTSGIVTVGAEKAYGTKPVQAALGKAKASYAATLAPSVSRLKKVLGKQLAPIQSLLMTAKASGASFARSVSPFRKNIGTPVVPVDASSAEPAMAPVMPHETAPASTPDIAEGFTAAASLVHETADHNGPKAAPHHHGDKTGPHLPESLHAVFATETLPEPADIEPENEPPLVEPAAPVLKKAVVAPAL
jgi:predicted DNA repair protein MutK